MCVVAPAGAFATKKMPRRERGRGARTRPRGNKIGGSPEEDMHAQMARGNAVESAAQREAVVGGAEAVQETAHGLGEAVVGGSETAHGLGLNERLAYPTVYPVTLPRGVSMKACDEGDMAAVAAWIDSGGDIDARGTRGYTLLMSAHSCGHQQLTQMLIARGASLELRDPWGQTIDKMLIDHVRYECARGYLTLFKLVI